MAYIGLRKPYVAKYNRSTKTYSDGFKYAKAVSMAVTPNYSEASLYADDSQAEYEKAFNNATVSLGTSGTPIEAASVVFGHQVDAETGKVIYKATDEANYVGLGVFAPELIDGATKYVALIIVCVKFADAADNLTTKGEQLAFNTPTIEGKASADDDDIWKITRIFDTAEDAENFVKTTLNISGDDPDPTPTYTYTEVTPEGTENPSEEGWYELDDGTYTLTEDTTVNTSKTYYTRS